jgi:hypothetical protein
MLHCTNSITIDNSRNIVSAVFVVICYVFNEGAMSRQTLLEKMSLKMSSTYAVLNPYTCDSCSRKYHDERNVDVCVGTERG